MTDRPMNLQLFADVTNTTVSSGEGNNLSGEMKTFYEKTLIDMAQPNLVHDQFGDKYPIPKNGGKTIEFLKFDSLPKATTALTEGVTPDGQSMNVSTVSATVSQYGGFVRLSDMLQLAAIDNNIVQATKMIGSQAGKTIDTIVRDVMVGGTNVMYAPTSAGTAVTSRSNLDATCKLTTDLVFRAAAQLQAMNAPTIDGCYVAIIHPYVAYDLMTSDGWLDLHKYCKTENAFEGEIGKIGNVRFVVSSEAKIWKDSTCKNTATSGDPTYLAVFATMVLGSGAYGTTEIEGGGLQHIVKPLGSGEDPLNQRSTVGWKATKVAERLVEQYMVRVESCSGYSATASAN